MKRVVKSVKLMFDDEGHCQGVVVESEYSLDHDDAPGGKIQQTGTRSYNRENLGAIPGGVNAADDIVSVVAAPLLNS